MQIWGCKRNLDTKQNVLLESLGRIKIKFDA
jgi:hypothetical protein